MDTTITSTIPMHIEGAILEMALGLEKSERDEFLDIVFRRKPDALARVKRMLARHGESSSFFLEAGKQGNRLALDVLEGEPEPLPELPGSDEQPGSVIGSYRIVSRIGEGGGGVVYAAEQMAPVRRSVALKILRLGMDTESVIKRFEAERQALALMEHPNIARVFDAGATTAGRPYFVMELVRGERVTSACDRARWNVFERIDLFLDVCQAIQHAHQKGVIHRDIKPSNILVTTQNDRPTPKVIDFGIAKATNADRRRGGTLVTACDSFMGTPPYMSPEQMDMGSDVDTRTDVYSLGVLLYELLAGRAPFDAEELEKAGIPEMRRILIEDEPPLMSRMLASLPREEREALAAARRQTPERLVAQLRTDLDWIVARAMEKDRSRRYETVNALAADLRRFLANEPVVARAPSRLYLLSKFVRRNRLACSLGAAVVVSLLGGLGASTTMYMRQKEALAEQERLSRVAEKSRAEERWLRQQAQARANVSQAAVLLSEGNRAEADALLRESPIESIEPSREASNVFRVLGKMNAVSGRWKQALQCYLLLDQANRLEDPVRILEAPELMARAPVFLKCGEVQGYEAFRRDVLDRYLPVVTNALQAEHLLKTCLLLPADAATLGRLAPAAKICAAGIQGENRGRYPAWEAFSMALYHHRRGDVAKTLEWAKKTLAIEDPYGNRVAGTLALTAIAKFRRNQPEEAHQDLRKARAILDEEVRFRPEWDHRKRGNWFSWAISEILADEAAAVLEGADVPGGTLTPAAPAAKK